MRVILDTNVLVSGLLFGGVPGRLLTAWVDGRISLVLSPDILDEYRRVGATLGARHPELADALEPVLTSLTRNAAIVDAAPLRAPVSEDPADDKFLAAAVASRTNVIVSGDTHLLRVSGWGGITVLTPRQFMTEYLGPG